MSMGMGMVRLCLEKILTLNLCRNHIACAISLLQMLMMSRGNHMIHATQCGLVGSLPPSTTRCSRAAQPLKLRCTSGTQRLQAFEQPLNST